MSRQQQSCTLPGQCLFFKNVFFNLGTAHAEASGHLPAQIRPNMSSGGLAAGWCVLLVRPAAELHDTWRGLPLAGTY